MNKKGWSIFDWAMVWSLVLGVLKMCGVTEMRWAWVFSPVFILVGVSLVMGIIVQLMKREKK